MVTVIGVTFRCAGKLYYFDPGEEIFARGDKVIVETARGREMGTVCIPNREVEEDRIVPPLKPVIRRASPEDMISAADNRAKQAEAYRICKERIIAHGLDMKLVEAEYTFDGSKVLFYFTADGRIDFRELVKDLASIFKTRIELRQIGVRDETKMMGGVGICGRGLCCATWMNDFVPVSIKMAKEQNLSLNPTKISGVCGRLMCCLKNEEETYEYLNSLLPDVGSTVTIPAERLEGRVQEVNVLRQKVKVLVTTSGDETELKEYPVSALSFGTHRKMLDELDDLDVSDSEYEELEQLEELEIREELEAGIVDENQVKKNRRRNNDRRQRQRNSNRDRAAKNDRGEAAADGGSDGSANEQDRNGRGRRDRRGRQEDQSAEDGGSRRDRRNRDKSGADDRSGAEGQTQSENRGERRSFRRRNDRRGGTDGERQGEPVQAGGSEGQPGNNNNSGRRRYRGRRPFKNNTDASGQRSGE